MDLGLGGSKLEEPAALPPCPGEGRGTWSTPLMKGVFTCITKTLLKTQQRLDFILPAIDLSTFLLSHRNPPSDAKGLYDVKG